ncbi:MAG: ATP-binding protein [Planctomycetes bacterium]|nr:ATP-binding protein [Planctomycetota bacterium]
MSVLYQRSAEVITTNKAVKEWPEVFAGDEVMVTALLDRLLYRCHVFNIKGRSYRLRDLERSAPGDAPAAAPCSGEHQSPRIPRPLKPPHPHPVRKTRRPLTARGKSHPSCARDFFANSSSCRLAVTPCYVFGGPSRSREKSSRSLCVALLPRAAKCARLRVP